MNGVLGAVIVRERRVAVEVIGADIEDGRQIQTQRFRPLQLKTGQLEHIQLGLVCQQVQSRATQIPSYGDFHTTGGNHGSEYRRDSGFAIGACNTHYGCLSRLHEQVNVTSHPATLSAGSLDQGMIKRHPGTHDHLSAVVDKGRIDVTESSAVHIDIGYRRRIVSKLCPGIDGREGNALLPPPAGN